jgi:hypothetical protein
VRCLLPLVSLPLTLALAACDAKSVSTTIDPSVTTYARDVRTDICFAAIGRESTDTGGRMSWSFSISAVPCSPSVLALVPKSQGGAA